MAGKKVEPKIAAEPSWSMGDSEGMNDGCFFGGDYKVSGGLHEFAWSFPAESAVGGVGDGGFDGLNRIESGFEGIRADDYAYAAASSTPRSTESMVLTEEEKTVSASNPSVSSSSCEDRQEKSTTSGGTSSNPPPDAVSRSIKLWARYLRNFRITQGLLVIIPMFLEEDIIAPLKLIAARGDGGQEKQDIFCDAIVNLNTSMCCDIHIAFYFFPG